MSEKQSVITYPTVRLVSKGEAKTELIIDEENIVPLDEVFGLNEDEGGMRSFILDERREDESPYDKKGLYLGDYNNGVDFIVVHEEDRSLTLLPIYRQ